MSESIIQNLKSQGYNNVYLWEAKSGETDPEHTHDFDTKLVILEGEIKIKAEKESLLKKGDEIEILRGQIHSAVVGQEGCKYIVAEKHYDA